MATIEKRPQKDGSLRWRVRIRKRGFSVVTETFSTKTKAQRWAKKTESEIEEGSYFGADKQRTIGELIDRFLETELDRYSPREQEQKTQQLTWWKDRIGTLRVIHVRPHVCVKQLDELKRSGRSPATRNRYKAALSGVFTVAKQRWQWASSNPLSAIPREQEPQVRVRWLSDDERDALLEGCKVSQARKLYPFVLTALRTGARQGSIEQLLWRDVDLERRELVFHKTKGRLRVRSHISADLLETLREWGAVRSISDARVFGSFPRTAWRRALRVSGVSNFRFHDLRHTCASYMVQAGATPNQIMEQLGLKTLQIVMKYAHLAPGQSDALLERISNEQARKR